MFKHSEWTGMMKYNFYMYFLSDRRSTLLTARIEYLHYYQYNLLTIVLYVMNKRKKKKKTRRFSKPLERAYCGDTCSTTRKTTVPAAHNHHTLLLSSYTRFRITHITSLSRVGYACFYSVRSTPSSSPSSSLSVYFIVIIIPGV